MKRVGAFRFGMRALSEYLYPARCVACRDSAPMGMKTSELIMKTDPDGVLRHCLCAECYAEFMKSAAIQCPECGKPYYACECAPKSLCDAGVTRAYSCFAYEKGRRTSPASRLIYALKGAENRDCVNFAAHLLAARIRGVLGEDNISGAVVTFAPRGLENVRKYGADHMKLTAKLTAKLLGCGYAELFVNISRGEQKLRGADERRASACGISLRRGADAAGKSVIVIDDIITSGATLGACVTLLRGAGAPDVTVFTLAKTTRKATAGACQNTSELASH